MVDAHPSPAGPPQGEGGRAQSARPGGGFLPYNPTRLAPAALGTLPFRGGMALGGVGDHAVAAVALGAVERLVGALEDRLGGVGHAGERGQPD